MWVIRTNGEFHAPFYSSLADVIFSFLFNDPIPPPLIQTNAISPSPTVLQWVLSHPCNDFDAVSRTQLKFALHLTASSTFHICFICRIASPADFLLVVQERKQNSIFLLWLLVSWQHFPFSFLLFWFLRTFKKLETVEDIHSSGCRFWQRVCLFKLAV